MTQAVCIRCGHGKSGALVPCAWCGFEPATAEDQARSELLSDRNLSPERLKAVSAQLRRGEPIPFREATVASGSSRRPPRSEASGFGTRSKPLARWITFGVAVLLGILFGACLLTML